ncbi:MAG: hypothetical protein O2954_16660 [bacterium]|nr:hypothetical protein [bacterium]
MKKLVSIQVAYRGFDHALTLDWIYQRINQAIQERVLDPPVHILVPGNLTIPIHFSLSTVETWKFHYERGNRVEVPRELWKEVDLLLGVAEK